MQSKEIRRTKRKIKRNIRELKKLIRRFKNVNGQEVYVQSWKTTIKMLENKLRLAKNGNKTRA